MYYMSLAHQCIFSNLGNFISQVSINPMTYYKSALMNPSNYCESKVTSFSLLTIIMMKLRIKLYDFIILHVSYFLT